jgi:NitT/TauT family transport system permease protein
MEFDDVGGGGWFFLMASEMFVLGTRDFHLPGLGSYMQVAASAGDTPAIFWGLATMIGVIAETRFKLEA